MQPRPASSVQQWPIALSRTPAANDSDGATRQTVEKMCELIRKSCADDVVKRCAAYAWKHFASGSNDPAMKAWGVWWYVKHCVKFRLDEGTMMMVGETGQQDLLIAPEVLVRMKDPSEDCDGFTMLTAALLTLLGVSVVIATVAVDQDDPSRWSHVFLCAILNGRVIPLDTSHGKAPGWMVPKSRINRWQTWTLDGRPADVQVPTNHGLHGYVQYPGLGQVRGRRVIAVPRLRRRRGVGQVCSDGITPETCSDPTFDVNGNPDGGCNSWDASGCPSTAIPACMPPTSSGPLAPGQSYCATDSSSSAGCASGYTLDLGSGFCKATNPSSNLNLCGGSGQPACVPGATNSPASMPVNWGALASQIVSTAGADAKVALQQPSNLLNAQTWANLSAYLPIIGIAVLGVVVLTTVAGKK